MVLVRALGNYRILSLNLDVSLGAAIGSLAEEFGLRPEEMEKIALTGKEDRINVPTPMVSSLSSDFSFQGPWKRTLQYVYPRS